MMKRLLCVAIATLVAMPAFAGVSVSIGEPGFFGTIDIGNDTPQPVLVNPQPVIVAPPVVQGPPPPPMYLRVPETERQQWNQYCGKYNACGRQVYFVQDTWYQNTYAPAYRRQHGMPEPQPAHHNNKPHHHVHRQAHPQQAAGHEQPHHGEEQPQGQPPRY